MGFSTLDAAIVVAYLVLVAAFGILTGGKQSSTFDYFLGGKRIPWWAVCFAVVATETSTLTFLGIPGIAYATNLNFLQLTLGYILGRVVVAGVFLPAYHEGELATAYAFLGKRFGATARNATSAVFMITRLLADGVRLYATAIPIKLVTGIDYPTAIAVTALITLVYTYVGGVRSVIWTDVVQMFIYLGGAVAAIVVLESQLPQGISGAVAGMPGGKMSVVRLGFDLDIGTFFSAPYTLFASVLGGAFLSMASHGTDQLIVQRLLSTSSLRDSQKALVVSGFIVTVQFAIFLLIGVLLFAFFRGAGMDPNEVFPTYIIHHLPSGVSGLIVAGLLAAAMSTLSGSVNALASATLFDFFRPYFKQFGAAWGEVALSRILTLVWCALLIGSAMFFMSTTKTVVELALGIASFTYGGLLGSFLLGVLFRRCRERDMLLGFSAGILTMVGIVYYTDVAWTWYTVAGSGATVLVGALTSLAAPRAISSPQEPQSP